MKQVKCQSHALGLVDSPCEKFGYLIPPNLALSFLESRGKSDLLSHLDSSQLFLCNTCIQQFLQPFASIQRENALKLYVEAKYHHSFTFQDFPDIPSSSQKKISHQFICSCGRQFDYLLDRYHHLDQFPDHHSDGELLDNHRIFRDEDIVGEPIVAKSTKKPKLDLPDDSLFD